MHDKTITLFNLQNGIWYPSVISGTTIVENEASSVTEQAGMTSSSHVDISIKTTHIKAIETSTGLKAYVSPKSYAVYTDPANCLTFKPEQDFIYCGEWPVDPVNDGDYESGFYHAMNDENDGVYMITSASWFGMITHFEIGGR